MGWLVGFSVVLLVLVGEKEVDSILHHPILHLLHHHIHKHFGVGEQP